VLLGELGGAPIAASAELDQARQGEIAMTLRGKFEQMDDPKTEEKALFAATKRYVLYLLKVQPADNLLQALIAEVTPEHEEAWAMVVREELAAAQQSGQTSGSPNPNSGIMEDLTG
jgi:Ras GTPase-activating-like protein IQGAP2/3